jgi:lipopolysaccharide export system protein LptC
MKLAISGLAARAQRRQRGEPATEVPANAAGRIFAAWPVFRQPAADPGNRHTQRVALLKRVLPAIGLALLLLIAMWPRLAPLWERMRLAFPAIDLREAGELRMINPRYSGADRLGRPFVVTAAVGRQVPDRQDLVSLEMPRGDMKTHGGTEIVVTAATGIYQSQVQLLDLFGQVTLVHQNGTRFVTDTARVDVANNAAEGHDPIAGEGPSGDVKADGFRILDKGDTIIFTGKSDMLLKGAKQGTEKTIPAALPAQVAVTAALVTAQAKPLMAAAKPAVWRQAATPQRAAATRKKPIHRAKTTAHAKPAAKTKS